MRFIKYILIPAAIIGTFIGYLYAPVKPAQNIEWGVSFSPKQAESLELDWREVYRSILTELNVTHLRLNSFWSDLEPTQGEYRFSDLDYMLNLAESHSKKVILVVGRRQPRWPECHIPEWGKGLSLEEQDERVLEFVKKIVERYRGNESIVAWQVENEFFLDSFGECPTYDKKFIDREIQLVRSLDDRPIMITDSGELSPWIRTGFRAEILGVSMYRTVLNPRLGYITYPHPPSYYSRLNNFVKLFTRHDKLIVSELQMEPWGNPFIGTDSTEENYKSFPRERFAENLHYARNSGVSEVYLWGVEWWYYMKEVRDIDTFWEQAKEIWN